MYVYLMYIQYVKRACHGDNRVHYCDTSILVPLNTQVLNSGMAAEWKRDTKKTHGRHTLAPSSAPQDDCDISWQKCKHTLTSCAEPHEGSADDLLGHVYSVLYPGQLQEQLIAHRREAKRRRAKKPPITKKKTRLSRLTPAPSRSTAFGA